MMPYLMKTAEAVETPRHRRRASIFATAPPSEARRRRRRDRFVNWGETRKLTTAAVILLLHTLLMHRMTALQVSQVELYVLSLLAVGAISWLFGLAGGVVGALAVFAANTFVLASGDPVGISGPFDPQRLVGIIGLMMTAAAVGQARDRRHRLMKALDDHRQIEKLLTEAHKELVHQVKEGTADLAVSEELLSLESASRKRAEAALWSLAEGTSGAVGTDFFPCLVQSVASVFSARYTVVAEHLDSPVTRVRTLAYWSSGRLCQDIEYAVAGTPCENATRGEMVFHPEGVQDLFPKDRFLAQLGIESYCALPLVSGSGEVLGHLAVLNDQPLQENLCQNPALRIFAARASAELARRQAEDQLQQVQTDLARAYRAASMGEMAAALAHEIDQPLGVIANDAQACLRGMQSDCLTSQETVDALDEIASEAIRAGEIVRRIRGFVAKRAPRRSSVDLSQLVHEAVRLVEAESRRRNIIVDQELHESLPLVYVDRIQLQQVLLNLLYNAFDAMEEAGEERKRVTVRSWCRQGEVCASVADRGRGIDEALRPRIFDPYFTTKPDGLGMGLSISRSIIQWHEGRLWAEPGPRQGTVFTFSLPIEEAPGDG